MARAGVREDLRQNEGSKWNLLFKVYYTVIISYGLSRHKLRLSDEKKFQSVKNFIFLGIGAFFAVKTLHGRLSCGLFR